MTAIPLSPQAAPPGAGRRTIQALAGGTIGAAALFLVLATLLVVSWTGGGEVLLESAAAAGPQPFTPTAAGSGAAGALGAKPKSGVTPATATTPLPLPSAPPISGIPAGRVGLYGGTGDNRVCDRDQLVRFLESNPAKARAWAGVLGVRVSDIDVYVRRLTPTVLLYDTRVTNHGFSGGRATSRQAVLQAGTAVLVDSRGEPVVRCACGNPLTAPVPTRRTSYTGQAWPGFRPGVVVVVVVNRPSGQSGQSGAQSGGQGSQTTTTTKGSKTIVVTASQAAAPEDQEFMGLVVGSTITANSDGLATGTTTQPKSISGPDGDLAGASTLSFEGTYDDTSGSLTGTFKWDIEFQAFTASCTSPFQGAGSGATITGEANWQCSGTLEGWGSGTGTAGATLTMQVS